MNKAGYAVDSLPLFISGKAMTCAHSVRYLRFHPALNEPQILSLVLCSVTTTRRELHMCLH